MQQKNGEEKLAEWYDEAYFQNYPRHDRRIAQIISRIPFSPDDVVCELGCGLGHVLLALNDRIKKGIGIDYSEYAVNKAQSLAKEENITNLHFLALNVEDLPGNPDFRGCFDKVLMLDISEHLYDETLLRFVRSTAHLLKPKGELYLHTPNAEYLLERLKHKNFILKQFPSHIAVRNLRENVALLNQAGFAVLSHEFLPHYHPLIRWVDRIAGQVPFLRPFFQARLLLRATPR